MVFVRFLFCFCDMCLGVFFWYVCEKSFVFVNIFDMFSDMYFDVIAWFLTCFLIMCSKRFSDMFLYVLYCFWYVVWHFLICVWKRLFGMCFGMCFGLFCVFLGICVSNCFVARFGHACCKLLRTFLICFDNYICFFFFFFVVFLHMI